MEKKKKYLKRRKAVEGKVEFLQILEVNQARHLKIKIINLKKKKNSSRRRIKECGEIHQRELSGRE